MLNREIPFRPKLEGDFRIRFYTAVSCINEETSPLQIEQICMNEINWVQEVCTYNLGQRKKYRAVWMLFRDLTRASWKACYRDGVLYMSLPSLNGAELHDVSSPEVKKLLRSWMSESRHERLTSYIDFIQRMERNNTSNHDISELIADGEELAIRLERAHNGEIELSEAVRPYLQLVVENERDDFTGIKTSEIWRYFRLTWSTPAETTPGRTMQYLMALVSDSKGNVPKGNEAETIYDQLAENEVIEDNITLNSVESMRNVMQRLLSVDKGVFVVSALNDSMISYSAGSKYFLTSGTGAPYERGGEFIGSIIRGYCPELASYIRDLLEQASDPITLLFEPVLEADMEVFSDQNQYEDIPAFKDINERTQWFLNGIKDGGTCLLNNLRNHPNPLTQLRLFNFFCVFSLMRYMTLLEAFYCGERIRPILLDFSGVSPSFSSVARASEMSYTQIYKSINRFYAWGYARWLDEKGYSKKELLQSETPVYEERKAVSKASKEELDALWLLAKERAADLEGEEMYLTFGETMYDMLALEASSHPITYLRALGNLSGILYPPDKLHPNKRFSVSQDIIEMLLRCCVNPGEMISGMDIRRRLWDRFGIIVGGSQFEMQTLQESGMILQIDEDALDENFSSFASMLESMDFAELMADGILQIRLGGAEK